LPAQPTIQQNAQRRFVTARRASKGFYACTSANRIASAREPISSIGTRCMQQHRLVAHNFGSIRFDSINPIDTFRFDSISLIGPFRFDPIDPFRFDSISRIGPFRFDSIDPFRFDPIDSIDPFRFDSSSTEFRFFSNLIQHNFPFQFQAIS
jgi:hypothetical protein